MTTKAPSMEPLATPKDEGAAPPAGGASAAPVALALPDAEPLVMDAVALAVFDMAPDVADMLELANDALGPTALLLTVLTAPEMVARLDCMLATLTLTLGVTLLIADDVEVVLGNVAWILISSHCAPMYSSYRL